MFVYHFVAPDIRVDILFGKRGGGRINGRWLWNRRLMHLLHTCIKIWKHFLQNCYAFLFFFFSMAKKNDFYLFMRHLHNMGQHTQTTSRQQPTNCLSVLDHFVGLALQGLKLSSVVPSSLSYWILLSCVATVQNRGKDTNWRCCCVLRGWFCCLGEGFASGGTGIRKKLWSRTSNTKFQRFFQLLQIYFFTGISISSDFTEINFVLLPILSKLTLHFNIKSFWFNEEYKRPSTNFTSGRILQRQDRCVIKGRFYQIKSSSKQTHTHTPLKQCVNLKAFWM